MKDIRRRATSFYVAVETAFGWVTGYYTLAAAGIPLAEMSPELAKKLPRYPSVPVARLGRLAVDQAYRGRKLGGARLLRRDAAIATAGELPLVLRCDANPLLTATFLLSGAKKVGRHKSSHV